MDLQKGRRKSREVTGAVRSISMTIRDPLSPPRIPNAVTDIPFSDTRQTQDITEPGNLMNISETDKKQSKPKMISKARKILTLFAGYLFVFLAHGFPFQLSVIYVELLEEFQETKAKTSSILSVCIGTVYISGILSGVLVKRCGVKLAGIIGGVLVSVSVGVSCMATSVVYLIISIGICSGFGFSILYINSSACVAPLFEGKSRNLALMSLAFASGAGWMAFPYIFKYFIDQYTWKGTFLIIGGICLNCIPVSMILVPSKTESSTGTEKKLLQRTIVAPFLEIIKSFLKDFKSFEFWMYALGLSIGLSALNVTKLSIIAFYESKNITRSNSVMIFFIMNVSGTVGRIIPVVMKYIPHMSILFINATVALVGAIAMMMLVISYSFLEITIASCCLGISLGCILTMLPLTVYKLIETNRYEVGIGISMTVAGLGIVIAGPVSGYMQDVSKSFDPSLYSASTSMFCSTVCFLAAEGVRKCRRKDIKDDITLE